jgi:hypothetical protein
MNLCERLEQSRPAWRTSVEFLPDLEALFPGFQRKLGTITEAYLKIRYGDLPELREEVEAVENAWRGVSEVGYEKVEEAKSRKKQRSTEKERLIYRQLLPISLCYLT